MKFPWSRPWLWLCCAAMCACSSEQKEDKSPEANATGGDVVLTVGSISLHQADLDHHIKESLGGRTGEAVRNEALNQLAERARIVQFALDENLLGDPFVRSEIGRLLSGRIKEQKLFPRLREIAASDIPEPRLRELYEANISRYRAEEKRQVAVLWLNPGKDPQRQQQYVEKLKSARDWFYQNEDLVKKPEMGFSTLAVDFSEHHATRYKNGIIGWLENDKGPDSWTRTVSKIAYSLKEVGAVSEVMTGNDGVFLVRYLCMSPAMTRTFESVAAELAQDEKKRLQEQVESDFKADLEKKYPVHWLKK